MIYNTIPYDQFRDWKYPNNSMTTAQYWQWSYILTRTFFFNLN